MRTICAGGSNDYGESEGKNGNEKHAISEEVHHVRGRNRIVRRCRALLSMPYTMYSNVETIRSVRKLFSFTSLYSSRERSYKTVPHFRLTFLSILCVVDSDEIINDDKDGRSLTCPTK